MKLSGLLVDSAKIEQGDWAVIQEGADGAKPFRVLVRGYGNSDYRRRQSELMAALGTEFGVGVDAPSERYQVIDLTLLCETILAGWDGLTEDDGTTEIPFSVDKAKEILADPDARLLRGMIEARARGLTIRRKQKAETAAGN